MENNKNKKSVKFQGDMLNFCDFIQVFVFTTNHHLKIRKKHLKLIQHRTYTQTLQHVALSNHNRSTAYERSMKEYLGRGSFMTVLLIAVIAPSDSFERIEIINTMR